MPPNPSDPGRRVVPNGREYLEYNDDGVPLGRWYWNPTEEVWVYEDIPLGTIPQTGDDGDLLVGYGVLGVSLLGLGALTGYRVYGERKRRRAS